MDKIEIFENERASGYDPFVETWIPGYNLFIDYLPGLLRETQPKTLLVAGCGTGNEIEKFSSTNEGWNITGIDPSPEMVTQAREKLGNKPGIELIEGVVSDLAHNQIYGAATLLLVLHFLKDNGEKLQLLKDIANHLLPGAPFVLLDITGDANQLNKNLEILRLLLPKGLNKDKITDRLDRIKHELYPVSEERLSSLCYEAGFEKPVRFFQSAVYMGWITKKLS